MKPVIKNSTVLTTIKLRGLEWDLYEGGIAVCNSTVGYMPMNKSEKVEDMTDVLKWLNTKFFNTFSEEEKKMIKKIDMLNENDWKIIDDKTYHFKQNIERICNSFMDFGLLLIINDINHYPCINKKGSNTWSVGNIFEGKFFGLYEFHAKVLKAKILPEYKKIVRIFFLENGEIFKVKLNIYKVTDDDSCVLNVIQGCSKIWGKDDTSNKEKNRPK